jgi:hypothetical protein
MRVYGTMVQLDFDAHTYENQLGVLRRWHPREPLAALSVKNSSQLLQSSPMQ